MSFFLLILICIPRIISDKIGMINGISTGNARVYTYASILYSSSSIFLLLKDYIPKKLHTLSLLSSVSMLIFSIYSARRGGILVLLLLFAVYFLMLRILLMHTV